MQGVPSMNTAKTSEIADEIVSAADRLRTDVQEEKETQDVFRDLHALRRSVETLERQVREGPWSVRGDAC